MRIQTTGLVLLLASTVLGCKPGQRDSATDVDTSSTNTEDLYDDVITVPGGDDEGRLTCENPDNWLSRSLTPELPVSVKFWVVTQDGSGIVTDARLDQAINELNAKLGSQAGISFVEDEIETIDDKYLAVCEETSPCSCGEEDGEAWSDLLNTHNKDGVLNIYIAEKWTVCQQRGGATGCNDACATVGGFSRSPGASGQGLAIKALTLENDLSVVTHEVGHFFGLAHTFYDCNGGCLDVGDPDECYDLGDRICDTTADPGLDECPASCNATCGWDAAVPSWAGPPIDNAMSYYPSGCATEITSEQGLRARCTAEDILDFLDYGEPDCESGACCDPNGNFRPDTYACDTEVAYECLAFPGTCGDEVRRMEREQMCSGTGSACGGDWTGWTDVGLEEACGPEQSCASGDPTCNSDSNCKVCDCSDDDLDGHYADSCVDSDCVLPTDDCDNSDPSTYPGATETPYDGVDQDCNGSDLTDVDGDGHDADSVAGGSDCDDNNSAVHPGASDSCDGIDNDCDGSDEGCNPEDCSNGVDDDGDSLADCADSDCQSIPTQTIYATQDTMYDEEDEASALGDASSMIVGEASNNSDRHSYIGFDWTDIPHSSSQCDVTDARLIADCAGYLGSGTVDMQIHHIGSPWSETMTGSQLIGLPQINSTPFSVSGCSGTAEFDLTTEVDDVYRGAVTSYGFQLEAQGSTNNGSNMLLYTTESSNTPPRLEIQLNCCAR